MPVRFPPQNSDLLVFELDLAMLWGPLAGSCARSTATPKHLSPPATKGNACALLLSGIPISDFWRERLYADSRLSDSRNIVDGVGQLEGPLRVATFQVAFLIPDAEDNRVSLFGDLAPFRRLEVRSARKMRPFG